VKKKEELCRKEFVPRRTRRGRAAARHGLFIEVLMTIAVTSQNHHWGYQDPINRIRIFQYHRRIILARPVRKSRRPNMQILGGDMGAGAEHPHPRQRSRRFFWRALQEQGEGGRKRFFTLAHTAASKMPAPLMAATYRKCVGELS